MVAMVRRNHPILSRIPTFLEPPLATSLKSNCSCHLALKDDQQFTKPNQTSRMRASPPPVPPLGHQVILRLSPEVTRLLPWMVVGTADSLKKCNESLPRRQCRSRCTCIAHGLDLLSETPSNPFPSSFSPSFSTIPAMVHEALWRLHSISHSAAHDDIYTSGVAAVTVVEVWVTGNRYPC
jgi:hypothetical protein